MARLYCVTNRENGKMYVGQTARSVQERWSRHVYAAASASKLKFHRAIRKYGAGNFDVVELFQYPTLEDALHAEMILVASLDLISGGYNSAPGGSVSPMLSPEVSARNAAARRGKKLSAEHRANMAKAHRGRPSSPHSDETRRKISLAKKGRPQSAGHIAAAANGKRGKSHSAARVEQRAAKMRGRRHSDERRAINSAAQKLVWARKKAAHTSNIELSA